MIRKMVLRQESACKSWFSLSFQVDFRIDEKHKVFDLWMKMLYEEFFFLTFSSFIM